MDSLSQLEGFFRLFYMACRTSGLFQRPWPQATTLLRFGILIKDLFPNPTGGHLSILFCSRLAMALPPPDHVERDKRSRSQVVKGATTAAVATVAATVAQRDLVAIVRDPSRGLLRNRLRGPPPARPASHRYSSGG